MYLYWYKKMCSIQILLLITLTCLFPTDLWAKSVTKVSTKDGIGNMTNAMLRDSKLSPLEAMARANKVNLVALETFGELNKLGGNLIRLLQPLSEQIENVSLPLLGKMFPKIFGDLKPSDIAIQKVTRPPDKSDLLIDELIDAVLTTSIKRNATFLK